ncbi:MAG: formylglycine-generating enzyme family protein [Nitrospirota bacterium]
MTGKILKNRYISSFLIAVIICFSFMGCAILNHITKRKIPDEMVFIPSGWFTMGSSVDDGKVGLEIGADTIPRHRVYTRAFYIDKYEVSVKKYLKFIQSTGRTGPSSWTYEGLPENETDQPVIGVTWYDADAYCKWAGKRLPTEEEWEKAARGEDGRMWPWGDDFTKGNANTLVSGIIWVVPVDSYPESVSPYGLFNMAGNAGEWTDSWYTAYPDSPVIKRKTFGKKYRVARGGSWDAPKDFARTTHRTALMPTLGQPSFGFRCAM